MRASTHIALIQGPSSDELSDLILTLRGHMQLLIPVIEEAAGKLPRDDAARFCALACVGEATRKLRLEDRGELAVRVSVAQKFARSVNALCDHHRRCS